MDLTNTKMSEDVALFLSINPAIARRSKERHFYHVAKQKKALRQKQTVDH